MPSERGETPRLRMHLNCVALRLLQFLCHQSMLIIALTLIALSQTRSQDVLVHRRRVDDESCCLSEQSKFSRHDQRHRPKKMAFIIGAMKAGEDVFCAWASVHLCMGRC